MIIVYTRAKGMMVGGGGCIVYLKTITYGNNSCNFFTHFYLKFFDMTLQKQNANSTIFNYGFTISALTLDIFLQFLLAFAAFFFIEN